LNDCCKHIPRKWFWIVAALVVLAAGLAGG
jgi:hypothetical protein